MIWSVGSDRSTSWATTTFHCFSICFILSHSFILTIKQLVACVRNYLPAYLPSISLLAFACSVVIISWKFFPFVSHHSQATLTPLSCYLTATEATAAVATATSTILETAWETSCRKSSPQKDFFSKNDRNRNSSQSRLPTKSHAFLGRVWSTNNISFGDYDWSQVTCSYL